MHGSHSCASWPGTRSEYARRIDNMTVESQIALSLLEEEDHRYHQYFVADAGRRLLCSARHRGASSPNSEQRASLNNWIEQRSSDWKRPVIGVWISVIWRFSLLRRTMMVRCHS